MSRQHGPLLAVVVAALALGGAGGAAPIQVAGDGAAAEGAPARLVAQVEGAAIAAEAIERSGFETPLLAALRTVVDANPGDPELLPFQPVRDGLIPLGAFTSFLRWQTPAGEGLPMTAVATDLPNHPFLAIVDFQRQLQTRGVELLVVLLPSRLEIHPELLIDVPKGDFAGLGSGTQRFVAALARAGVDAVSLTAPFVAARAGRGPGDPLFLRHDPHLTPRGYELAASVAAERLAQLPGFARGTLAEGRDFRVESVEFAYKPGETLMKRGSQVEAVKGRALIQGDKLFDMIDPQAPLVVLGDSHSRLHSVTACDFCTQLGRFTGQKVDSLKADGGAADQTRRKLARREADRWKSMKTIVWLVPETILVPALRWKPIALDVE